MRVAVIGQGYVGLSISVGAFGAGHEVIGVDLSERVVSLLALGGSHVEGIEPREISDGIARGLFKPTMDYTELSSCDVVIIAVLRQSTNQISVI